MELRELLAGTDVAEIAGDEDVEITGLAYDSRRVEPGDLFFCVRGERSDGHDFAERAVGAGAAALVVERALELPVTQARVPDARAAMAPTAVRFWGDPTARLRLVGITGTNGKTTTTYLLRHLLGRVGQKCGLIGTVEIDDGRSRREAEMTTPRGAIDRRDARTACRDRGCRAAVIEAAPAMRWTRRLTGVYFSGAAFTNLTGDHLDYHKKMDAYAAAKAKLFEGLDAEAVAVINDESKWSDRMMQDCSSRIIRFGVGKRADFRARDVVVGGQGSRFSASRPTARPTSTCDSSAGTTSRTRWRPGRVAGRGVRSMSRPRRCADRASPGALQPVEAGQPFAVLVDYAHTDDALENVLSAARVLTGASCAVFGCGGDRDVDKRPRMAEITERIADSCMSPPTTRARSVRRRSSRRSSPGFGKAPTPSGWSPTGDAR